MFNRKSTVLVISTCVVIYMFYYYDNSYNSAFRVHTNDFKSLKSRDLIYNINYTGTEDFLINTPGCYIPNYEKTITFNESINYNLTCGERAISIKRLQNDTIAFRIDMTIMKKYTKKKYICCYKFASRSNITGKEDTHLSYTDCKLFKNGAKVYLKEEVITVTCYIPPKKTERRIVIYEDAYTFIKRVTTTKETSNEKRWNVLLLGMDTMSRARLRSSMPGTVKYLQKHGWLDYRGYQKVGYNTFPNLMAILTGKKLTTIYEKCALGMDKCNDIFIWTKFHQNGYITAYGEDNLNLPDTFSRYKGFQTPPTHHYMRPFFLTGEKLRGNLICAKHKPSVKHLLEYAYEFTNNYKSDKFFGMFWLNSYSHNLNNVPTLLDNDMVFFFEQLRKSGVKNNTIIIMLSDHGIRYGKMRVLAESYYGERLPMFYIWIPQEFRELYKEKYYYAQLNQNRLVTPYDIYVTLAEISETSNSTSQIQSEACPQCTSLFKEKTMFRTCSEAGVSEKWCTCHTMTEVSHNEIAVNASLQLAVKYIQNVSSSVKTIKYMACSSLQLETVLRSHAYIDDNSKTHYVVAWRMRPGNVSFEATVVKNGGDLTILEPVDTISAYNTRGNCVLNSNDRPFCVCEMLEQKKDT